MANTNNLPDELNPEYMFQTIDSALLVKAFNGEINLDDLVKKELSNRGLDPKTGAWVGFSKK